MNLFAIHQPSPPASAVEFAAHRVSAATLDLRGGRPVIAAHASEPLPPGVVVPSLTSANVQDRAALTGALGRVFDRLGGRPRRIGVVVPDLVGKVSLVRFEQVPSRQQDLDQLIRWQVRKTAPFALDEAQVSYVRGLHASDGQEFVVTLARRSVVEEYESVCAELGANAGIVDLATFNVINAVLASSLAPSGAEGRDPSTGSGSPRAESRGDWLLVNVAADSASIAIMRGADLIFFRNRAADAEGSIADLVHQTAMYYEDRLSGGGFARVVVAGAAADGAGAEAVRHSLSDRLTAPIELVDPRGAASLTDRITASPSLLDSLAPLVGLLVRDSIRVQNDPAYAGSV